jgi:hypothetical protein
VACDPDCSTLDIGEIDHRYGAVKRGARTIGANLCP